jgi:hypothetical protein
MVCHGLREAAVSVLDDHCQVIAKARAEGLKRMRGWNFDSYGDTERVGRMLFDFLNKAEKQEGTLLLDYHQVFLVHQDLARELESMCPWVFGGERSLINRVSWVTSS